MPGMRCAVAVCNNSYLKTRSLKGDSAVSYFRIPKDEWLRKIWIEKCKRKDKWKPDTSYVCSDHFKMEDFERNLRAELMGSKQNKFLKKGAIPSLNLLPLEIETIMEMPAKAGVDTNDEATSKSELEYDDEPSSMTIKSEPVFDNVYVETKSESRYDCGNKFTTDSQENMIQDVMLPVNKTEHKFDVDFKEEENKFALSQGELLKTKSENIFCKLEDEEACAEVKEEPIEEVTIEEHDLTLPDCVAFIEEDFVNKRINKKSCSVLQSKNMDNFSQANGRNCEAYNNKSIHNNLITTQDKDRICKYEACGEAFSDHEQLMKHRRTHKEEKRFKCEICDRRFALQVNLVKHNLTHTTEKLFPCEICAKAFHRRSSLVTHTLIHTGLKPFKCKICGKGFNRGYCLEYHTRTHMKEKPFKCDICGQEFIYRKGLVIHARTHTGEAPYKCDFCGRLFRDKTVLLRHNRIHTGEKPFKCNSCGKSFSKRENLVIHLRIHTGEKPYKCDICGKTFNQRGSRYAHIKIHYKQK
ncbi:zinc finger protein 436-like isoform X1 [Periplaneta americana]|uniref:zinc finger protein 436-like isoform X1 n=1 Tax=Periplaneta americana TaxID=6978 RepID=UPI0037E86A6B